MPRIYLAGPDVFFPDAIKTAQERKAFLATLGLEGAFPLDPHEEEEIPQLSAAAIFAANCRLLDSCDAVLANMTPFRGPSTDVGTAWEIGYAHGRGKPVAGYSDDLSVYREKVFRGGWSSSTGDSHDRHGHEIENFDKVDNLMLTESICALCASFEEAARELRKILVK